MKRSRVSLTGFKPSQPPQKLRRLPDRLASWRSRGDQDGTSAAPERKLRCQDGTDRVSVCAMRAGRVNSGCIRLGEAMPRGRFGRRRAGTTANGHATGRDDHTNEEGGASRRGVRASPRDQHEWVQPAGSYFSLTCRWMSCLSRPSWLTARLERRCSAGLRTA